MPEPVAIIGTGCRFPGGSNSPSQFWKLLSEPYDVLEPLEKRFSEDGWYHKNGKEHGHANVRQSYLLSENGVHRQFDANFFGINASEATTMDPQMRHLLETVYEALEAAGQPIEALRGSDTAVYTAMMTDQYKGVMERDLDSIVTYHASGTSRAMMSNRVSFFFDWHGPSMTIDTACSSSLIAVHQAVMQLRTGQSRVAIAAGSNLLLDPADYISMSKLEMLSSDSRSRMWDYGANGYARGEGVAAVVLKTVSAAEADGDSIECIIRETATNQDGRTPGITMPSAEAQLQLIRDCYARAGLDPTNPAQRPQYFEAHGTGTRAGDPVEAQAIQSAFFSSHSNTQHSSKELLVGSVKTVIGHSESTAGLAGLIKVSLALQNRIVPPNLLFREINPKVEPFYKNLRIPTSAVLWPDTGSNSTYRASVNSFGFGGSNAHAILEAYKPPQQPSINTTPCFIPFVFSAASSPSLLSNISCLAKYTRANQRQMSLRELALTLQSRRSRLRIGATITATTVEELHNRLDDFCEDPGSGVKQLPSDGRKSNILAIFTGQGAQSARMAATLIEQSSTCREIIQKLDVRLSRLPRADRPSWSLEVELQNQDTDRISKAALAQPLCTALQLLHIELLRAAGIKLSAIIGHSSGEIAAACCAGMISAEEAICIAYYRGRYLDAAMGTNGQQGAMLAVGTSYEDALSLCQEEEFEGRVSLAAVNAAASVTLSGDIESIEQMKMIFEDEGKFIRRLKVDKAYHSLHMVPCSAAYLCALRGLGIRPQKPTIPWFSSVDGGRLMEAEDIPRLKGTYWNDNMVQPVLFRDAVEVAWKSRGAFDMALEVGPHPALKGPVLQTIEELSHKQLPYTGTHLRGESSVESFAMALGHMWANLPQESLSFSSYENFLSGQTGFTYVKGLAPYTWDHGKEFWHESRYARAIRTRPGPMHELLGHLTPDGTDLHFRWRKILSVEGTPWLRYHALQQQPVFPAAAYAVVAIEAAMAFARARCLSISLIEVLDLDIERALPFDSEDSRIETVTALNIIRHGSSVIEALFEFTASPLMEGTTLAVHASGRVRITLGTASENALPKRTSTALKTSKVESEVFYESLSSLGYEYTGPFRALSSLERRLGYVRGQIANEHSALLIHPAVLDAAFQSLLLAYCAPDAGGIWSLQVPRTIGAIRVNPLLCSTQLAKESSVVFDCELSVGTGLLEGDINIFSSTARVQHAMIQVEALHCVSLSRPTARDDKAMFSTTVWDVESPNAQRAAYDVEPSSEQVQLARLLERMAMFYLRRLETNVPKDHEARVSGPLPQYFKFASKILSIAKEGSLPLWSAEWEQDTSDDLASAFRPYLHIPDVRLLQAIGENIIDIATGKTQGIEIGMKDDLLSKLYAEGLGFLEHTRFLARLVRQITHRYPDLNILEVGAGTGGATKLVFHEIGQRFASYTYTDISSGFFEAAQQAFSSRLDKMSFKVLDISKDIRQQGYSEYGYDIVIASWVLHATPMLRETITNIRRLIKPGGFLVVTELHDGTLARAGTIFGALPGWWLGVGDGRALSPAVDPSHWDNLLRECGFSGCDSMTPTRNSHIMPMYVFVSQAVDYRVDFLRGPLVSAISPLGKSQPAETQELVLLGGNSTKTSSVISQLQSILGQHWGTAMKTVTSLSELVALNMHAGVTALSIIDIDEPVLEDLSDLEWEGLKLLLHEAGTVLWVSSGRLARNPHANMMTGFFRCARREIPTLDVQSFDYDDVSALNARELAEVLLRLKAVSDWHRRDGKESLLVTNEPELVREKNGTIIIPRLIHDRKMNDRYNSSRRPISTIIKHSISGHNIAIAESNDQNFALNEVPEPEKDMGVIVQITHSLRSAVRISRSGFMYPVIGNECESGRQVVALASRNASKVAIVHELAIPMSVPVGCEAKLLTLLAHSLFATKLFEDVSKEQTIIFHEPYESLAVLLADEAKRRDLQIIFMTASPVPKAGWTSIHPMTSTNVLKTLIPNNAAAFLSFDAENSVASLGARIRVVLPTHCEHHSLKSVFRADSNWEPPESQRRSIRTRLERCVSHVFARLMEFDLSISALSIDAATEQSNLLPITVIDWKHSSGDISIQARPAYTQVKFTESKTYWLAGLGGGLGLLLCEWMVQHGAKYIVISSRNPQVQDSWLKSMRSRGAVIMVFSCDITKQEAVESLYENLRLTCPPVSGVCQGAMVLEDTSLRDMSLQTLRNVTNPKVRGSVHLDRLFQDHGSDLEFFVFFSSAGSLTGQIGQSNYAAANLFMTALAEQRRRRGQVASIMHIGAVLGVGYIHEHSTNTSKIAGVATISEQDVCQHFAEAIIAGRNASKSSPLEIATGLSRYKSTEESGPLLSHLLHDEVKPTADILFNRSKVTLKSQLENVWDRAQLADVVRQALLLKISTLFQIELSKLEQAEPSSLRLNEMGVDSLIATELRSWFVNSLQINIPVLKILSGVGVTDLVEAAVEMIPRRLLPSLAGTSDLMLQSKGDPLTLETTSTRRNEVHTGDLLPAASLQLGTQEKTILEADTSSQSMGYNTSSGLGTSTACSIGISEQQEFPQSFTEVESTSRAYRDGSEFISKLIRISYCQKLFWFSAAFADDPTNLNSTATFRVTGVLDVDRLKLAAVTLGQQHESLRTRFLLKDDTPMQSIMTSALLNLEHHVIVEESDMASYVKKVHSHVYDLESGDTLRLLLLSLSSDDHFLILGVHHLTMDGQSFFPFMKAILRNYTHNNPNNIPFQFSVYSEDQYKAAAAGEFQNELAFWKSEMEEMPPILPVLRTSSLMLRPSLKGYGNRRVDVRIGQETRMVIQATCRKHRVTPFHYYLAVFRVLLSRFSSSDHFSIGIGDANRSEDLMDSIGSFLNLLPLVFHTDAAETFERVLETTREKTFAALAHSRLPFQLLLDELRITRSAITTPIFQTFIDYRLARGESLCWGDIQLDLLSLQPSKLAYDVAVDIIDDPHGDCHVTFFVRDDLYSQVGVEQFARSYVCLVDTFSSQTQITIGKAPMFERSTIEQTLDIGRGAYNSRQWGGTVIHRINDIATRYPERTAVITSDGFAGSYKEVVHDKVDAIVAELLASSVANGSLVAVLQEPTADWVSSILAIIRVGAIYIPLDVGMPFSRLSMIVEDCCPHALLVDDSTIDYVQKLNLGKTRVLCVKKRQGLRVPIAAVPEGPFAILYTSGSTGTPKGIVLKHQGIRSWLEPWDWFYGMNGSGEVILQQSSQGFDMSLMQIFMALCFGGSVCLIPRRLRGDASAISDIIARHGITHTFGTPSEYSSWLRYGVLKSLQTSSWKTALVGGEPLAASLLRDFARLGKSDLQFHHMYGTTESTFCAAVMKLDYGNYALEDTHPKTQKNFPAGLALPNYNIYVLDEERNPLPIGMIGEIYIGGAGVAQGYLNNPSLTAETFMMDPFATADDHARGHHMMQRTGDLGRWSQDEHGALLIEGRISGDTMIKLRGLRVDLREIEVALLRAGASILSEAIVTTRKSSPSSPEFLVAHVLLQHPVHEDQLQNVRSRLELPRYMQPAFIIALDELPTTNTGKRDRQAISSLPLPQECFAVEKTEWTATEKALRGVWEDIISSDLARVRNLTPETDFFHIGGTSLSLLPLRERIRSHFGVELQLIDLFEASVLSHMARRIDGKSVALDTVDWDEETSIPQCMAATEHNMLQEVSQSQSKVVLITGATGYLGKALVCAMVGDPTVKEIHCLGVRDVSSRTDLRDMTKVKLYEGNLCSPRMRLPQLVIDDLFSRADVIIHNGADTSYMKTYQSLRQSNFLTTKDLLEWSMPRMVPFHYISTAGIGNFTPGSPLGETSVASARPPTDGSMAYTACKWASERFLEKLVDKYPLWRVCVHRPTLLSRDDLPQLDGLHNVLGYARKLGAVPTSEGVARGLINVVELETVVRGVLACALRPNDLSRSGGHQNSGGVHFVNHIGKLDLPLNNMKKWALERGENGTVEFSGVDLPEIPMDEWIRRACEAGMHPTIGALFTSLTRSGEIDFPIVNKA
ncbi:putative hybrid NRPS/PKS enzyme [Amniculicola lignicola CBS 123094]|uniref:Putative hybrid NRPS/PKS enzyme n=1 Tax=Amniculicola lignicola CBS 123094 TaxID=1392246 RepID=A0A6A5VW41_9PLEO|nr:putative hybrid NRPS/PKS enzyme [Amniculicola lignicola CBS 123094]